VASAGAAPEQVLADAAREVGETLGSAVLGVYVHGSWVAGDFDPARSDLDLLAVLREDPWEATTEALAVRVDARERAHPAWAGRLEVELVGAPTLVTASHATASLPEHRIARVSPGERLHLLSATRHRLLTWASVRSLGVPLLGPPSSTLLPDVAEDDVREALLDHVRDWPYWVRDMRTAGGQAYAVLSVCRALRRLDDGEQVSKRRAAALVAADLPEWAGLVRWASDWWYDGGDDTDPGDRPAVTRFVTDAADGLLDRHHRRVAPLFARLPEGTSRVRHRGRTWAVTRTVQQGGRVETLWGEELGGTAVVSANLYLTGSGERLRPCEMPATQVLDLLTGWEPAAGPVGGRGRAAG
jgi:hypothetical protein